MRSRAIPALVSVALLALLSTPAFAQDDGRHTDLPNFHKVNDALYRGGQPQIGGMERLRKLGIKTVINLRDDDSRAKREEVDAQSAGLQYFNFPFARLGGPRHEDMAQVLSIINNAANHPVFVHCKHGADRTGVVIAIYRITQDGWTGDEARAEAKRYGLKPWQLRMKRYISAFYKDQTASAQRIHDRQN